MGWSAVGVVVAVDWHVFAGGRWMVAAEPVGSVPVNVETAVGRWEPVVYRHQAGACTGGCVLSCGHTVGYGCDCDTIAAEAAQGDEPVRLVLRLVCSGCGDVRPDADVMGEGVSLGARCGYVDCSGVYRDGETVGDVGTVPDGMVIETIGCTREGYVSASEADAMIESYDRNRYEVRRRWDRVSYTVALAVRGEVLPFASYAVPLV